MGGTTGYQPVNRLSMNANGLHLPGPGDRVSFLSSLNDNDEDETLHDVMKPMGGTSNFGMTVGKPQYKTSSEVPIV